MQHEACHHTAQDILDKLNPDLLLLKVLDGAVINLSSCEMDKHENIPGLTSEVTTAKTEETS